MHPQLSCFGVCGWGGLVQKTSLEVGAGETRERNPKFTCSSAALVCVWGLAEATLVITPQVPKKKKDSKYSNIAALFLGGCWISMTGRLFPPAVSWSRAGLGGWICKCSGELPKWRSHVLVYAHIWRKGRRYGHGEHSTWKKPADG